MANGLRRNVVLSQVHSVSTSGPRDVGAIVDVDWNGDFPEQAARQRPQLGRRRLFHSHLEPGCPALLGRACGGNRVPAIE